MAAEFEELKELVFGDAHNIYSETVIDHTIKPRNAGAIPGADGFASITGPCGDTMRIWLKVNSNTVIKAGFTTDGCGVTIASGSITTAIIKGKSINEAMKISQQDILDALGGLPDESKHCALLAANTMKAAAKDYIIIKREPWKKAYRKYQ